MYKNFRDIIKDETVNGLMKPKKREFLYLNDFQIEI